MKQGRLATEDEVYDPTFFGAPRARTEDTPQNLARAAFAPPPSAFHRLFVKNLTLKAAVAKSEKLTSLLR
jgi:hypothetical protein